jgi:mycofactocin precursor
MRSRALSAIAESAEPAAEPAAPDAEPVVDDLLVEEISIDGMCGVY